MIHFREEKVVSLGKTLAPAKLWGSKVGQMRPQPTLALRANASKTSCELEHSIQCRSWKVEHNRTYFMSMSLLHAYLSEYDTMVIFYKLFILKIGKNSMHDSIKHK